jgi:hypothetical protein
VEDSPLAFERENQLRLIKTHSFSNATLRLVALGIDSRSDPSLSATRRRRRFVPRILPPSLFPMVSEPRF